MTIPVPDLHHGAIGNGRVLALISPTSAIEWLCLPRFDSSSVFGRILDKKIGGTFRFLAFGKEIQGRLAYLPNTNVLAPNDVEIIRFAMTAGRRFMLAISSTDNAAKLLF